MKIWKMSHLLAFILAASIGAFACGEDDPEEKKDAQCEAHETLCGSLCVDTQTSDDHCGECNNACTTGMTCEEGTCAGGSTNECEGEDDGTPCDNGEGTCQDEVCVPNTPDVDPCEDKNEGDECVVDGKDGTCEDEEGELVCTPDETPANPCEDKSEGDDCEIDGEDGTCEDEDGELVCVEKEDDPDPANPCDDKNEGDDCEIDGKDGTCEEDDGDLVCVEKDAGGDAA